MLSCDQQGVLSEKKYHDHPCYFLRESLGGFKACYRPRGVRIHCNRDKRDVMFHRMVTQEALKEILSLLRFCKACNILL